MAARINANGRQIPMRNFRMRRADLFEQGEDLAPQIAVHTLFHHRTKRFLVRTNTRRKPERCGGKVFGTVSRSVVKKHARRNI